MHMVRIFQREEKWIGFISATYNCSNDNGSIQSEVISVWASGFRIYSFKDKLKIQVAGVMRRWSPVDQYVMPCTVIERREHLGYHLKKALSQARLGKGKVRYISRLACKFGFGSLGGF